MAQYLSKFMLWKYHYPFQNLVDIFWSMGIYKFKFLFMNNQKLEPLKPFFKELLTRIEASYSEANKIQDTLDLQIQTHKSRLISDLVLKEVMDLSVKYGYLIDPKKKTSSKYIVLYAEGFSITFHRSVSKDDVPHQPQYRQDYTQGDLFSVIDMDEAAEHIYCNIIHGSYCPDHRTLDYINFTVPSGYGNNVYAYDLKKNLSDNEVNAPIEVIKPVLKTKLKLKKKA